MSTQHTTDPRQVTIEEILRGQFGSGAQRRDRGIKTVLGNTPDTYRDKFEQAVMEMKIAFTSEDIIEKVGMPPNHPSAVGAAIRALATRGVIKKTGLYKNSQRPKSHAAMLALWIRN